VNPTGPVRKSHGGAGRSHGTIRPRGQTPGAAANAMMHREVHPAKFKHARRRKAKRHVGAKRRKTYSPTGGSKTAKSPMNPKDVAGIERFRPGRDNSPNRGPGTCAAKKPATNDPAGGVSRRRNLQSTRDARHQKPQGRKDLRRGCRDRKTSKRNGLEAGRFQAAQRDQGTSKGQNAEPQERRFARLSAHQRGRQLAGR
jgi:hypothetical protein